MLHRHVAYLKEKVFEQWGKGIFMAFIALALLAVALVMLYAALFGPPGEDAGRVEFVVRPEQSLDEIAAALGNDGFIRHAPAFLFAYATARGEITVRPGGYQLSRSMDAWSVAKTLGEAPYLTWITIPDGVRKEEIAEILVESLGWTLAEKEEWLAAGSGTSSPLYDGVYYPDVYLIPSDQPPAEVAARFRGRFEEVFAPYVAEAAGKGLAWADVVNLAALIEKESGKKDKALVSGILHNRLNKGMLLQVDATLQYLAATPADWWPAPDPDDKYDESLFNTYQHEGLPPHPIANPSIASIEAAINPQKTSCLYYLHDAYGRIHCSTNYQAHLSNVRRYLR